MPNDSEKLAHPVDGNQNEQGDCEQSAFDRVCSEVGRGVTKLLSAAAVNLDGLPSEQKTNMQAGLIDLSFKIWLQTRPVDPRQFQALAGLLGAGAASSTPEGQARLLQQRQAMRAKEAIVGSQRRFRPEAPPEGYAGEGEALVADRKKEVQAQMVGYIAETMTPGERRQLVEQIQGIDSHPQKMPAEHPSDMLRGR